MPIPGMTDQLPAFPQIGVIRKGAPKQVDEQRRTERPGEDLDHFRVEFDPQETEAAARFAALYLSGKPQEIDIVLPFDEIERCWEAWQEAYLAGSLIHRCDGQFVQYAIDPETGQVTVRNGLSRDGQRVPCNGDPVAHYTNRKGEKVPVYCKPCGRLRVIVPELRRLAYLTVLTTSVHDIVNISRQLTAIKDMNGGQLRGIPLVMRRRPKLISTPSGSNGKRARREKWLISIEADPQWVEAKIAQLTHEASPQIAARPEVPLLAEPELVGDDDEPEEGNGLEPGDWEEGEEGQAEPEAVKTVTESEQEGPSEEAFIHRVLTEIPYYGHVEHVRNTMAKFRWAWDPQQEEALLYRLNCYASRRANEKAAAQEAPEGAML